MHESLLLANKLLIGAKNSLPLVNYTGSHYLVM